MQCPYCQIEFDDKPENISIPTPLNDWRKEQLRRKMASAVSAGSGHGDYYSPSLGTTASQLEQVKRWNMTKRFCPKCKQLIIRMHCYREPVTIDEIDYPAEVLIDSIIWPKNISNRPPCTKDVPADIADDYREACLTLDISPKASAALSRRCLQNILRKSAGVKTSDLSKEIQEVLDKNLLPSYIAESIDAVRNIGNFAAHPIKSQSTGEVQPVELGEAEWNLSVLEALFDFYYTQPAIIKKKRDALNQKLEDSNKPLLR